MTFHDKHVDGKSVAVQMNAPYYALEDTVLSCFSAEYKVRDPLRECGIYAMRQLTGSQHLAHEIDHVIPFLPFSKDDAAVLAHKLLLDLSDRLRKPIDASQGDFKGPIHLTFPDETSLCRKLADEGYFATPQARGAGAKAIGRRVRRLESILAEHWLLQRDNENEQNYDNGLWMQFEVEVRRSCEHDEAVTVRRVQDITAPRSLS